MLFDYGYLGMYLILAIIIPASMILIPLAITQLSKAKVKPHNPTPVKLETYECGMETIGPSRVRFNFRYYIYALLFLVFDVEVVFIFPWAIHFRQLGGMVFGAMLIFLLVIVIGYLYEWKKGGLEWK